MDAPLNQIFYPSTFADLFDAWERFPEAVPYAGGTGIVRRQGDHLLNLPPMILSLDKLDELREITRTERYLEFGAMVKLNQIIMLGKAVPEALRYTLEHIASPQLRNVATIGGNICYTQRLLDTPLALVALDAQYELRTAQSSRWISATRFTAAIHGAVAGSITSNLHGSAVSGDPVPIGVLEPQELLTRIRVPLEQWNYTRYKKFTRGNSNGAAVFMMKTQKSMLSDLRILYKTTAIFRNKDIENILAGKQLPLSRRLAGEFLAKWDKYLNEIGEIDALDRREMFNYLDQTINSLSE